MKILAIAALGMLAAQTAMAQTFPDRGGGARAAMVARGENQYGFGSPRSGNLQDEGRACLREKVSKRTFCYTRDQWRAIALRIEKGQSWQP